MKYNDIILRLFKGVEIVGYINIKGSGNVFYIKSSDKKVPGRSYTKEGNIYCWEMYKFKVMDDGEGGCYFKAPIESDSFEIV